MLSNCDSIFIPVITSETQGKSKYTSMLNRDCETLSLSSNAFTTTVMGEKM